MKRIYIWIICISVGISFVSLLYLQGRYADAFIRIRKEQFDESVFRSLDQASRDLERAETFRYLQKVLLEHHNENHQEDTLDIPMHTWGAPTEQDNLDSANAQKLQQIGKLGHRLPVTFSMPRNTYLAKTISQLQKHVKDAYIYEQGVLEEVIYAVMYQASELRFQDRLNPAILESSIRSALERNGITILFHYEVFTSDGRRVCACQDFDPKGKEVSYSQTLFRSDPSGKMGVVTVHFPDQKEYILGVASYVAPAMVFTVFLLIIFLFTVYLAVRQKRVNEMKNDFIHNMTHEFKTPISTISLAAQMLADSSVKKSESTYDRLGTLINTETKRLRFQVEKVLQMSLFDRNNIALKFSELDMNEMVENVAATFSLKVTQHGGSLNTHLAAAHPFVNVDEMHMTNIVFNLLDNAVKYRRDEVPLSLNVATWSEGKNFYLSVQDNGIGIQKEDLKHIFDRFYRVHMGDQHDFKGFGLGLAYVKKMVELHRGNIRVSSEVGHGTKFTIMLPNVRD